MSLDEVGVQQPGLLERLAALQRGACLGMVHMT
jgi:hypothetical protein